MIKLLIGGSPCTHWSIAQTKNREVTANGLGWELFKNYLCAKERFKPDFFLYENNKSAAQVIKDQISKELGVKLMYINSALVSAQNRQRFYAFNWRVQQPADRVILLKDILEGNETKIFPYDIDKTAYALDANSIIPPKRHGRHDCIRIGTIENSSKNKTHDSKQYRVYSTNGKSTTLCGQGGGLGAKTGLYAVPIKNTDIGNDEICNSIDRRTCVATPSEWLQNAHIYEVRNGLIFIKENAYPIELDDGCYAIRKLTVTECSRLQTLPDNYCKAVSKSQAYKGLGNGWTAEVIIHILSGALVNVDPNEKIIVLSMYDGIGTGRYCLEKMGFKNIEYYAFEIDKYAMKVANDNYCDIIQCGDAFQIRNNVFNINGLLSPIL